MRGDEPMQLSTIGGKEQQIIRCNQTRAEVRHVSASLIFLEFAVVQTGRWHDAPVCFCCWDWQDLDELQQGVQQIIEHCEAAELATNRR